MHIAAGAMADLCGGVHAVYLVFKYVNRTRAFFILEISASRGGTLKYTCRLPDAHTESQSRPTAHRDVAPHSALRTAGQPLTATSEAAPHRRAAPSRSPTLPSPLYPPRRCPPYLRAPAPGRKQVCRQRSLPGNKSAGRPRADMAAQSRRPRWWLVVARSENRQRKQGVPGLGAVV